MGLPFNWAKEAADERDRMCDAIEDLRRRVERIEEILTVANSRRDLTNNKHLQALWRERNQRTGSAP